MLNALIIDKEQRSVDALTNLLNDVCPSIQFCERTQNLQGIAHKLSAANVVFLNTNFLENEGTYNLFKLRKADCEIICLGNTEEDAYKAFKIKANSFLKHPYHGKELLAALNDILMKMTTKLKNKKEIANENSLIGIPTISGMEYFYTHQIIKCEGLLKCTKVSLSDKGNIVSSYNIGEFIKLLTPFGFYAPHKSHLINLHHVKKYLKEGTIILSDKHTAPVARRRKAEFLTLIPHL